MRSAFTVAVLAGAFGLTAQSLLFGHVLGLSALPLVGSVLAMAWTQHQQTLALRDAWMPIAAVIFATFLAVRADMALVAFNTAAALCLIVASIAAMRGSPLTTAPLVGVLREVREALIAVSWRATSVLARARRETPLVGTRRQTLLAYVTGGLIAVPLVITFALLFSAADAVFARRVEELFDPWTLVREAPGRLIVAAIAFWATAGAMTLLERPLPPVPAEPRRALRAEIALVPILAVDLLFALFVSVQITYLFSGHETLVAADIPYSAYARRGFFELVSVAMIVAGLLFLVDILATRSRALVLSALVLLPLTGVVLASATYRLTLYQDAYGWSELRLYAIAAIAFLAIGLVILGAAIVAGRMHYALQPLAIAALAVALAVNAIAPSAFIARANLDRAIAHPGAPERVDLVYLVWLGDGARAELVAYLDDLPETERFCLSTLLRWNTRWSAVEDPTAWQTWNMDRERARKAMLSVREELFAPLVGPGDDYKFRLGARIEERYRQDCAPTTSVRAATAQPLRRSTNVRPGSSRRRRGHHPQGRRRR